MGGVYSAMWNQQLQSLDTTNVDPAHEQEVGGTTVKKTELQLERTKIWCGLSIHTNCNNNIATAFCSINSIFKMSDKQGNETAVHTLGLCSRQGYAVNQIALYVPSLSILSLLSCIYFYLLFSVPLYICKLLLAGILTPGIILKSHGVSVQTTPCMLQMHE